MLHPESSSDSSELPTPNLPPEPGDPCATTVGGVMETPAPAALPPRADRDLSTPLPSAASWPTVPGYVLLDVLGRGGLGVVYKAREEGLGRLVALKMLRAGTLANGQELERFRREARALARLDHSNVVTIFSEGMAGGQPYFTMKLVEGGSLSGHLGRCRANLRGAVTMMVKVARAVHYLHEHKIIHRDLKPLNILLGVGDEPFVTDFGVAKLLEAEADLTGTGQGLGTVPYMAPEQLAGQREVGPAADVWALGVVLYELLCGVRPFRGATEAALTRQIARALPEPLRCHNKQIDRELEAVTLRCLALSPLSRYPSAGALADDLQRWLNHEKTLARPAAAPARLWNWGRRRPQAVALAVLLASALLLGAVATSHNAPEVAPREPNRPAVAPDTELRAGRPVNFVGGDGTLRHARWRAGEAGFIPGPAGQAIVSFHTRKFSVLELRADVPAPSYRLRALVRHQDGRSLSEAGLVLFLRGEAAPLGEILTFLTVGFNDVVRPASAAPQPREGLGKNRLLVDWRLYHEPEPLNSKSRVNLARAVSKPPLFAPTLQRGDRGKFRDLRADVTPAGVRVFWEGVQVMEISAAELLDAARMQRASDLAPPPNPDVQLGTGVGLYCIDGAAAFRDVVLSVLPNQRDP